MAVRYTSDVERRHKEGLAATTHVSIYSYTDRVARGVIKSMLDKKEIPFCGFDQMILIIEEILDREEILKNAFEYRYIDRSFQYESWLEQTAQPQIRGFSQNFLIRVYGRLNRSMQGEMRVKDKQCYFRSGMELMRFMHQWLQIESRKLENADKGEASPLLEHIGFAEYNEREDR